MFQMMTQCMGQMGLGQLKYDLRKKIHCTWGIWPAQTEEEVKNKYLKL